MINNRIPAIAILLIGILLTACHPVVRSPDQSAEIANATEQNTTAASPGSVEVDLFSGRPNPVWNMTVGQVTTLVTMLQQCPSIAATSMFDGLGYRGFLVTVAKPSGGGGPFTATIHDGVVKRIDTGTGQSSYCDDTNRKIEGWLLDESRANIDSALQSIIEENWN